MRWVAIWMIQVRARGSQDCWLPTGADWYPDRCSAIPVMKKFKQKNGLNSGTCWPSGLEYRIMRYVPTKA